MTAVRPIGDHLREWRQRRRLTQLELALGAGISARHLSFVETGRSQPSREMILHLSEMLDIPMRDRNVLLVAAGLAPVFPERVLGDPALDAAQQAIALVLEAQKPYPAFALDRHWRVVASNGALPELYVGVAPELLASPINAFRLSLHPDGMAPRIANLHEWRAHLLSRLRRQIDLTADAALIALLEEVEAYPAPSRDPRAHPIATQHTIAVPFQVVTDGGLLSFFSTTTVFGTPIDVTLSELALELFFPADAATSAAVKRLERDRAGNPPALAMTP